MQRGQGSMEYLMTHGLAILVVIVVGIVLWQSGVFGNSSESITGFQKIRVGEFVYNTNDGLSVVYTNTAGTTLKNVLINYSGDANGTSRYTGSSSWAVGEEYTDKTSDVCNEGSEYIVDTTVSPELHNVTTQYTT